MAVKDNYPKFPCASLKHNERATVAMAMRM